MSTRARIAIRNEDGSYDSVYLHFDGNPEHTGSILDSHHTTRELARTLVDGGNIRGLDHETGGAEYYHRDRGESWEANKPRRSETLSDLLDLASRSTACYLYVFQDDWTCMTL